MIQCYHRFHRDFIPSSPHNSSTASHANNGLQNSFAYYTSPEVAASLEWLMDSEATNHVTADLSHLEHKYEYDGLEKFMVGNGQGLSIANIGCTMIKIDSKILQLNDILHVPLIKKNLLSIAKLTNDNNVIVEFDCHFVYVKDPIMRRLLLQ